MKIAVCVRGCIRSWDVCKHNIFKTFKTFPCQLDWFFDTWDVDAYTYYDVNPRDDTCRASRVETRVTEDVELGIKKDFEKTGMNLVSFNAHEFDSSLNPSLSFLKLIYLSNNSKRKVELMTNSKYDIVIQIRPDTVFTPQKWDKNNCVANILESKGSFGLNYNTQVRSGGNKLDCFNEVSICDRYGTIVSDVPGIPDFSFYGPSQVIDLLSSAYIYAKEREEETNFCFPHATLFSFLEKYGVIMYNYFLDVTVVRNMRIEGKYEYEFFKKNPNEVLEFSDNFSSGLTECSNIWYNLYDRFKII